MREPQKSLHCYVMCMIIPRFVSTLVTLIAILCRVMQNIPLCTVMATPVHADAATGSSLLQFLF